MAWAVDYGDLFIASGVLDVVICLPWLRRFVKLAAKLFDIIDLNTSMQLCDCELKRLQLTLMHRPMQSLAVKY